MFNIISSDLKASEIIEKAFLRSHGNVKSANNEEIFCFISPSKDDETLIDKLILSKNKIVILGKISPVLAKILGLKHIAHKIKLNEITYDHSNIEDKSNYLVKYNLNNELCANISLDERYFYRFDFTDEWNNLGYGLINTVNDIWSISDSLENIDSISIADVYNNEIKESIFVTLKDFDKSSVLFINREVGTIDGLDWVVVEDYISSYKNDKLQSAPLIKDIPANCQSVVSSRLDCDQSVLNTKYLVDLYKEYNIDITLGISTGIEITDEAIDYLNKFYTNGGAVLSHTVNHNYSWGENYDIAFEEAKSSKVYLEQYIENIDCVDYAVSPFHSNEPYAIQALNDCGYKGFISGIIHNDPEYLVCTSGVVPFVNGKIITHSQQCMLHGDSYHRANNSIDIYKNSFQNYYKTKKMFGYLDHPFGEYDYAWKDEEERLSVHKEFIEYINSFDDVKWMTGKEILDFVYYKSLIELTIDENDELIIHKPNFDCNEKVEIQYKNKKYIS